MKISFIIKALNEEKKIERCINSIERSISLLSTLSKDYETEIILVDSCSTDSTVNLAKKYNIKIVQFLNKNDANCGSAVELGYQVSCGDYIYIIDGDMELESGFLSQALSHLNLNPTTAGVSGLIKDKLITSFSDRQRVQAYSLMTQPQKVTSLGGGGLYRRDAIESVGYMGHQWLESCEELELGVRLLSNRWSLVRLPIVSVSHTGHGLNDYLLLYKYFRAKRFMSIGKVIKSSLGKNWQNATLNQFKFLFIASFSVFLSVFIGLAKGMNLGVFIFFAINFLLFIILTVKKKNHHDAFVSIITWYICLFHGVLGLTVKEKLPTQKIKFKLIKDAK